MLTEYGVFAQSWLPSWLPHQDWLTVLAINVLIHVTIVTSGVLLVALWMKRHPALRYWLLCGGLMLVMGSPLIAALCQSLGVSSFHVASSATESPAQASADVRNQQPTLSDSTASTSFAGMEQHRRNPFVEGIGADEESLLNGRPRFDDTQGALHRDVEHGATGPLEDIATDPTELSAASLRELDADRPNMGIGTVVGEKRRLVLRIAHWVQGIWFFGSVILLFRLALNWVSLGRLLREARPVTDDAHMMMFRDVLNSMPGTKARSSIYRQEPRLVTSEKIGGPLAAGWRQPTVVLPPSMLSSIDGQTLREILVHELAHLQRKDHWVVLLQNVLGSVFWVHPLVRSLNIQLAKAREEVCDNHVLSTTEAPRYSRTLLRLAEMIPAEQVIPGTVGLLTSKWRLEQRIAGLLDRRRDKRTRLTKLGGSMVAIWGTTLVVIASMGTLSIAQPPVTQLPIIQPPAQAEHAATIGEQKASGDSIHQSEQEDLSVQSASEQDSLASWSGRVTGPGDAPVTAQLWLGGPPRSGTWLREQVAVRWWKVGRAGEDGQFTFTLPAEMLKSSEWNASSDLKHNGAQPSSSVRSKKVRLVATFEGLGFAWVDLNLAEPEQSIRLRLVPDRAIEGRLVGPEGQPVENATVMLVDITAPESLPDSKELVQRSKLGSGIYTNWPAWYGGGPLSKPMQTNADGRFRLVGCGTERWVRLQVQGQGIGAARLSVLTRDPPSTGSVDSAATNGLIAARKGLAESNYFASFTHVASSERTLRGTIRDIDTGEPIAGVQVVELSSWPSRATPSVTDDAGEFEIRGVAQAKQYELQITPRTHDYLRQVFVVKDETEDSFVRCDTDLHPGTVVRGRVIDSETGEGVAGSITYNALFPNPQVDSLKEERIANPLASATTDADGNFEIGVLAGPGALAVRVQGDKYNRASVDESEWNLVFEGLNPDVQRDAEGHVEFLQTAAGGQKRGLLGVSQYQALKLINVKEGEAISPVRMKLERSQQQTGWLLDDDGRQIKGVEAIGLGTSGRSVTPEPLSTNQFIVHGVRPGKTRTLLFLHRQRSLGARWKVDGDRQDPLNVRLTATGSVTGRFVDELGRPVSLIDIELNPEEPRIWGTGLWSSNVQRDGRFRLDHLIEGTSYRLVARLPKGGFAKTIESKIVATAGSLVDLGTFVLDDDGEFSKQKAAGHSHRKFSGLVIDEKGSPATGATVTLLGYPKRDSDIQHSQVLAVGTADKRGTFELNVETVVLEGMRSGVIVSRQADSALDWKMVLLDESNPSLRLRLDQPQPIQIRLVDLEGQPAAGLEVRLKSVFHRDDLTEQTEGAVYLSEQTDAINNLPSLWQTDPEGRLVFPMLGANHAITLEVQGNDQIAPQTLLLNSGLPEERPAFDATYRELIRDIDPNAEETIPLAPAKPFAGVVYLGESDTPAANAKITIWSSQQRTGSMVTVESKTDEMGRFRLNPQPGIRFGIQAFPPKDSPYQTRQLRDLTWRSGPSTEDMTIRLPEGALATGRIVDAATQQPLEGATIQYLPDANNPSRTRDFISGWQHASRSDADGRFSIATLPGKGMLMTNAGTGRNYVLQMKGSRELRGLGSGGLRNYAHAFTSVDMIAGQSTELPPVELKSGKQITLRFLDSDGNQVNDVIYTSTFEISPLSLTYRGWPDQTTTGKAVINGVASKKPVYCLSKDRKLGATVMVSNVETSMDVVLLPCASASLQMLDSEGDPVANMIPGLQIVVTPGKNQFILGSDSNELASDEDYVLNLARPFGDGGKTDASGKMQYQWLIPGATYRLFGFENGKASISREFVAVSDNHHDLGRQVIQRPNG